MGYSAITGTVIAEPRPNVLPGSNVRVVNLTIAVDVDPIGKNVQLANGDTVYMLQPQSDIHDVAVWDPELQDLAMTLVKNQIVTFVPSNIKGGKPYERDVVIDGKPAKQTVYTTRVRAKSLTPGAIKAAKGNRPAADPSAAPVAAGAAAGSSAEDPLNF